LALDGVRIAIDDPFLWSGCDPGVAEAAKDAVDALVLEGTELHKMTLPEAPEVYAHSSRVE
jgi:Asp-tRNA(Asn)/Glu-tRNA(Gln) amidotransferase A subunit family amidase